MSGGKKNLICKKKKKTIARNKPKTNTWENVYSLKGISDNMINSTSI